MSGGPPQVPGGRAPEEREAARREREALRLGGQAPAAPGPAARAPRRRRGGVLVVGFVGALLLAACAWFLLSLFQPFADDGKGEVSVAVPTGAGLSQIGHLLAKRGVVSSSLFFMIRARLGGRAGRLKPGAYRLRRDMSYAAAIDALVAGPPPDIVKLTIPEGRSRREVSRLVHGSLRGDYVAATRRSPALRPRRYGAKRGATLEGFLFPATYQLRRGGSVDALVDLQLAAFKRAFRKVRLGFARRRKLTPYDVLTIASMVEREAQLPRERRLVASVIYNRLRRRIPLQIDATIRFATDDWTRPIRRSEQRSRSPYNTYRHRGLPPGPIGSPGLASIEAAARPARTGFLYYVVKPCGDGAHAFSRSYAQFLRDRARYERARARRGGRSPTRC